MHCIDCNVPTSRQPVTSNIHGRQASAGAELCCTPYLKEVP